MRALDYSTGRMCLQCGVHKPPDAFQWKDGKRRLASRCRECRNANYKENPHRVLERAAAWYAANKDRAAASSRAYRQRSLARGLVAGARRRAQEHGLPFDLTEADIEVPTHCPVLGIPLVVNAGRSRADSPTLDRIIQSRGYVRGNVIVVSHRANTIKNDATLEELERVTEFYARLIRGL